MPSPNDLKFTSSHEWCRVDGDVATVGVSQHAVEQLTDLIFVDLPEPGKAVAAGKPFGEIESVKAVGELNAPVSGEVIERNDTAAADLSKVTDDPYGDGWLIRVRMSDPSELDALMDAAAYDASVEA